MRHYMINTTTPRTMTTMLAQRVLLLLLCISIDHVGWAWNMHSPVAMRQLSLSVDSEMLSSLFGSSPGTTSTAMSRSESTSRRDALFRIGQVATATPLFLVAAATHPIPVLAYTPDPDQLQVSLYLISRVQEATVQQERFVNNSKNQEELKNKMKLTLKLVEKNYLLVDQINYCSAFVQPADNLVEAVEAGNIAVDALDSAIDYVRNDLGKGPLRDDQKEFLSTAMQDTRENLFVFLQYMPPTKLQAARRRVEEENVLNRDEFDGDADAGVYNPVVLPWKQKEQQLQQQKG